MLVLFFGAFCSAAAGFEGSSGARRVLVGDLDGDRDQDVVLITQNQILIYENVSGYFKLVWSLEAKVAGGTLWDVDADGRWEAILIPSNPETSPFLVLAEAGGYATEPWKQYKGVAAITRWLDGWAVATTPLVGQGQLLFGDGHPSVLLDGEVRVMGVWGLGGPRLLVITDSLVLSFADPAEPPDTLWRGEALWAWAGDLNRDGFPEPVLSTRDGLLSPGGGPLPAGAPPLAKFIVGDLTGDLRLDVLGLDTDGNLWVWEGGPGGYLSPNLLAEGIKDFSTFDYDDDGDPDVILAGEGGVRVLENTSPVPWCKVAVQDFYPGQVVLLSGPDTLAFALAGPCLCVASPAPCTLRTQWPNGDRGALSLYPGDRGTLAPSPGELPADTIISLAPNPAYGVVFITYKLESAGPVSLQVLGSGGKVLAVLDEGYRDAGRHWVSWDGTDRTGKKLPQGTYFVVLRAQGVSARQKLIWFP